MTLISLVGMPGSGKSTTGRQLARRIGTPFFDTDTLIEERLGESIRSFFDREGEESFRDVEEEVLSDAVGRIGGVLATGGGIVLRPANRATLRERSTTVYLTSAPEALFRRLKFDSKRPLLQTSDPLARLQQMHAIRDPLYRETAHFVIATGRPTIPTVVTTILCQLELAGLIDPGLVPSIVDPLSRSE